MSTYVFKAIDLAGARAGGEVEAESKQSVADQLKARGLIVLDIADKHSSREINLDILQRIKAHDVAVMTRQLATMVGSGMTILRALYVLEEQTKNKLLIKTLVGARKDVEAGLPLSDALERHPKVFGPLYVAMVRAGETGGMLHLPAITQVTVGMSKAVTSYWYLLILGVVGAVWSFLRWKRSEHGRAAWDAFKLRIPFKIGDICQKVALARWSRTLSALVGAGVPLLQSLDITGKTAGNMVIERAMGGVIDSVKQGGTISDPLKESAAFPSMVAHMVGVGEETGSLDTMLSKIADFYEDEVAAAVKALTSILEPVMIVVVGGMVGFIVISMYMPLFKVYDSIK
ncbi:MAG: type II secretion system F family protein [Actinobacteria bacterium]|nr:MAG: type II secretion system F family protein [Actinomycetota bacterium]